MLLDVHLYQFRWSGGQVVRWSGDGCGVLLQLKKSVHGLYVFYFKRSIDSRAVLFQLKRPVDGHTV